MKFSIIIPVFNGEAYIERCIESIICQDFPENDFEIIIIDDCSTDNTFEIINSLINNKQNRGVIKLLSHKKNKKQGGARNTALDVAKGEWLFFVDADDCWIYENTLTLFDEIINEGKINIVRSIISKGTFIEESQCEKFVNPITSKIVNSRDFFKSKNFSYEIWSGCYKRKFLTENKIRFIEGMFFEDTPWNTEVMYKAGNIKLINFPFYLYDDNPDSTTRKSSIDKLKDNARSCIEVKKFIEKIEDNSYKKKGYERIKNTLFSLNKQSKDYKLKDSYQVFKSLKQEGLLDKNLYNLNTNEKIILLLMGFCPYFLLMLIKIITNGKRIVNKNI